MKHKNEELRLSIEKSIYVAIRQNFIFFCKSINIYKSGNGKSGNEMRGMIRMREIRMGMDGNAGNQNGNDGNAGNQGRNVGDSSGNAGNQSGN